MSYAAEHPVRCAGDGCEASIPGSRWHQVKAQDDGWFFQRDGRAWCPACVPSWVPAWRARKQRERAEKT